MGVETKPEVWWGAPRSSQGAGPVRQLHVAKMFGGKKRKAAMCLAQAVSWKDRHPSYHSQNILWGK